MYISFVLIIKFILFIFFLKSVLHLRKVLTEKKNHKFFLCFYIEKSLRLNNEIHASEITPQKNFHFIRLVKEVHSSWFCVDDRTAKWALLLVMFHFTLHIFPRQVWTSSTQSRSRGYLCFVFSIYVIKIRLNQIERLKSYI